MRGSPETAERNRQCRDVSAHQERVEKLLYDRKSAAHALSISVRSLDYLLSQRAFRARRIGKKVLIPASELKRFACCRSLRPYQVAGPARLDTIPRTGGLRWSAGLSYMPRKVVPKATGVFEKSAGSGVWWIRYRNQGQLDREKVSRRQDAIDLYKLRKAEILRGRKLPQNLRRADVKFRSGGCCA